MLDEILQLDHSLFLFLNNLGSTTWDTFWFYYTEKRTHIPLILILLIVTFRLIGWKKFLVFVLVIVLMATFTDQITNVFKHHFQRLRPCNFFDTHTQMRFIAKRCSKFSYFSGHASNSMALAVFFFNLFKIRYPKIALGMFLWAFMMGYSRIYVGVHYPGDVLSGFVFGALSGYAFYKLYVWFSAKMV